MDLQWDREGLRNYPLRHYRKGRVREDGTGGGRKKHSEMSEIIYIGYGNSALESLISSQRKCIDTFC